MIAAAQQVLNEDRLRSAGAVLGFEGQLLTPLSSDEVAGLLARSDSPMMLTDDFAPIDNLIAPVFARSN